MIYGFVDSWEPVFKDLNIPKYFTKYRNNMATISKDIIFINLKNWETSCLSILEKTGTNNDEDPRNKILKILDMRWISIKNTGNDILVIFWNQEAIKP